MSAARPVRRPEMKQPIGAGWLHQGRSRREALGVFGAAATLLAFVAQSASAQDNEERVLT
jgi:hypothetical protein